MLITEESGTTISATTVLVRSHDGQPDARFDFETRLDRMVARHAVPNELQGRGQADRRHAVENAAFAVLCTQTDPSLERLLNPGGRLHWYAGLPEMPGSYAISLETEWVEYLGANHRRLGGGPSGRFEVLARKGSLELHRSAHGAVLVNIQSKRFAWLYVYPGGVKLRIPSILAGEFLEGEKVRLELAVPELTRSDKSIVVDLVTGGTTTNSR